MSLPVNKSLLSALNAGVFFHRPDKRRAFEEKVDGAVDEIFKAHAEHDHWPKNLLQSRKNLLVQQAAANAGIPTWINPAYQSTETQDEIIKEMKTMICCVGTPQWHAEQRRTASIAASIRTPEEGRGDAAIASAATVPRPAPKRHGQITEHFLNFLKGKLPSLGEAWKARSALPAILWKKNPQMLKEVRTLFHDIFNETAAKVLVSQPTGNESFHYQTIIFNLLSYYIFLDPQEGSIFNIPQLVGDKWVSVPYKVERMELTPSKMGSPLIAFGLVPQVFGAPPLLLFKGTTYPADDGFFLSLLADIDPHNGAGGWAFNDAYPKIDKWLKDNTEKAGVKARVTGQSLGGSLSQKAAIYCSQYIESVFSFNPPGLSKHDEKQWNELQTGNKEKQLPLPKVQVYCQDGDLVHTVDYMVKEGWDYYRLFGDDKNPSRLLAHAFGFSLHDNCIITKMVPAREADHFKRKVLPRLKRFLCALPFYFLLIALALIGRISFKDLFNGRFTKNRSLPVVPSAPAAAA